LIRGAQLRNQLKALKVRPLSGTFFRAVLLKFSQDPLGRRRSIIAQRFNVARGARVLYLADTHETALHEVRAFGFPLKSFAIVPVQVTLSAVIDLQDLKLRRAIRLSKRELGMNFRSLRGRTLAPTQELGEACAACHRVDGLLYPSLARRGATNLAILEAGLKPLGGLVVVNDAANKLHDRLP